MLAKRRLGNVDIAEKPESLHQHRNQGFPSLAVSCTGCLAICCLVSMHSLGSRLTITARGLMFAGSPLDSLISSLGVIFIFLCSGSNELGLACLGLPASVSTAGPSSPEMSPLDVRRNRRKRSS